MFTHTGPSRCICMHTRVYRHIQFIHMCIFHYVYTYSFIYTHIHARIVNIISGDRGPSCPSSSSCSSHHTPLFIFMHVLPVGRGWLLTLQFQNGVERYRSPVAILEAGFEVLGVVGVLVPMLEATHANFFHLNYFAGTTLMLATGYALHDASCLKFQAPV